jgi:hypothetical protein
VTRLLLALAIVLGESGASRGLWLEVSAGDRVLWRGAVERGEDFDVAFIHSAERCLWTQHYQAAAAGDIEQLASTFSCFGAGMPATSTDGSPVRRSADGYRVAAPAHLGDLAMMAWRAGDIALLYRQRRVPIGSWFHDFDRMVVRVR